MIVISHLKSRGARTRPDRLCEVKIVRVKDFRRPHLSVEERVNTNVPDRITFGNSKRVLKQPTPASARVLEVLFLDIVQQMLQGMDVCTLTSVLHSVKPRPN